jgi:hypothetical protein
LSKIRRQDGLLEKYWTTGFVRSSAGFSPTCSPISAASSILVLADSALTKNLCSNFAEVSGWWRTAWARLVLPIPPPPKMAILGDCWQRIFIRASNSDLRPWKILGFGGNIENEFELEKPKKGQVMKQSLTYFLIHLHPNISGPELFKYARFQ